MPVANLLIFLSTGENQYIRLGKNVFNAGHFSFADSMSCVGTVSTRNAFFASCESVTNM